MKPHELYLELTEAAEHAETVGMARLAGQLDALRDEAWFLWCAELDAAGRMWLRAPIERYEDNPLRHEPPLLVAANDAGQDGGGEAA